MSTSRQDLAVRRQVLMARSALVREQVIVQSAALTPMLRFGDRARAMARWVRQHPEAVFAVTVGVVIIQPARAWRWGLRAWSLVRMVRRLQVALSVSTGR